MRALATSPFSLLHYPILLFEMDSSNCYLFRHAFSEAGFQEVSFFGNEDSALEAIDDSPIPPLFIVSFCSSRHHPSYATIAKARRISPQSMITVISRACNAEMLFNAAIAGANDFLVEGPHLDLGREVRFMLMDDARLNGPRFNIRELSDLGFFRTCGLSKMEIVMLREFANGFPRYKTLSKRMNRSEVQIRKSFSQVFEKVGVSSLVQLTNIVTILSMY